MLRLGGRDRALASGVIVFIMMIVVAGLLFIVLNAAVTDLNSAASGYTDDADAQNHIDLLVNQVWLGVLVFALFLATLFIVARAVLESRRPG